MEPFDFQPTTRPIFAEHLGSRLEQLAEAGGLPRNLRAVGVPDKDLKMLADEAAEQWTGGFNPRVFDASSALEIYQWAL